QGLTDEHYLELDLGELDDPRQITLFLTGWVWPTDTSINISIAQNPEAPAPRPPSVWTPDADGEWKEVVPYMGFPGGKTKTIAVDLSSAFPADDYRVRIVTSMEIYWDEVFFTVDEEPSAYRKYELPLVSGELRFRGFSERVARPHHAPETYDHSRTTRQPQWPPMAGQFTRYGDVTELVRATDDLQVVFGAGDALTLAFQAPDEPLPDGWTRDFLVYNVGWDKDADLNTVYGQTVGPLPFRAMPRYPYQPDTTFPATPRHRRYLDEYQTRQQDRVEFWRQILNWDGSS
ncbi:MAG: hypothetical protein ACREIV_16065, partial [Planctomycetaceae bacterium]